MRRFSDVFDLWPSRAELADDMGEKDGTVRQWANRNYVRAHYFDRIVAAAQSRGFNEVTHELLSKIAANAVEAA